MPSLMGGIAIGGPPPTAPLSYLATDTALMIIFGCMVLLLLGVLIRMRQLRSNLERESDALKKSETHLKVMGDSLPDTSIFQLVYDINEETFRFSYISKGYDRILGLDRHHIMDDARLMLDHIYEDDIAILKKAFTEGKERLEASSMELRFLDAQGNYKWLHVGATPQIIGQHLVWDGFMQDISARKNAEQTAGEESHNFKHLLESIDDLLIVCDLDGKVLHSNPAMEQRMGYSSAELVDMSFFELYPEAAQEEVYKTVARLRTEASATCGLPLQIKDGAIMKVEMNLFRGTWKHQTAFFGIARDIARHQQTESALRESQKMLQLIIDSIPMSIFWKDKESMYLGCNDAFVSESNVVSQEDVVGKSPFDLFEADLAATIVERDQSVINTNQPLMSYEESHTRHDGSIGWREISLIPLRNDDGKAVGILGVWRDITEQNRAEERLKRTLDDMERFNQLMRGRERRTLELKDEINNLMIELGRPKKYRTTAEDVS